MIIRLAALLFCFISLPANSFAQTLVKKEWSQHFEKVGLPGVFVLLDPATGAITVSDQARAEKQFVPASTFKIPNSLIALETAVVQDEHQLWPWDGTKRKIEAWNRVHTLRSAFRHSVVPLYQELARRIGPAKMQESLRAFNYGNQRIEGGIDQFWLDGELRISAVEQVRFLQKLYEGKLPVSERSRRIVMDIMLYEATPDYRLRAKTGYRPPLGWWVGWVESEGRTAIFALNLDLKSEADLPKRIEIAKSILRAEGVLPAGFNDR